MSSLPAPRPPVKPRKPRKPCRRWPHERAVAVLIAPSPGQPDRLLHVT
jgi:hypothetical protein